MTVINGIEIDNIEYKTNHIKEAILNNDPIEEYLHVIAVISNPCLFARRYILMKQFIDRIEKYETHVKLYIVELAYKNQKFMITDAKNPKHLQLRSEVPLWHKENMINLGVQKLLPSNYKAFAWIDADLEFESCTWAQDTLKILNGTKDIVQIFSHALDMNREELTMRNFNSAGYQFTKQFPFCGKGDNFWHPGFAWAITRKAYEKIGGLYELGILGSGDNIMMFSLIGHGLKSINKESTEQYKDSIVLYEQKIKNLRFGYVPGVIRHYFHGTKANRKYTERWQILINHEYDPYAHICYDKNGLLIPNIATFPEELKSDIMKYFEERQEDD
jgi:hypothetical protein